MTAIDEKWDEESNYYDCTGMSYNILKKISAY